MEICPEEQKAGLRWLFVAGFVAIALSFALKTADDSLSNSKGEHLLGATLKDMRTAQASMAARVTDARQAPVPQGR